MSSGPPPQQPDQSGKPLQTGDRKPPFFVRLRLWWKETAASIDREARLLWIGLTANLDRPSRPEQSSDRLEQLKERRRVEHERLAEAGWKTTYIAVFVLIGLVLSVWSAQIIAEHQTVDGLRVPPPGSPAYQSFISEVNQNKAFYSIVLGIPAGVILGISINAVLLAARRSLVLRRISFLDQEIAEIRSKGLQATLEEDFFTKLVKINFTYIDRYYAQT